MLPAFASRWSSDLPEEKADCGSDQASMSSETSARLSRVASHRNCLACLNFLFSRSAHSTDLAKV